MLVPRESWPAQVKMKVHPPAWRQEGGEAEHEGSAALMFPDPFQDSGTGKFKIYKGVEHQVTQQSLTGNREAETAKKQWYIHFSLY